MRTVVQKTTNNACTVDFEGKLSKVMNAKRGFGKLTHFSLDIEHYVNVPCFLLQGIIQSPKEEKNHDQEGTKSGSFNTPVAVSTSPPNQGNKDSAPACQPPNPSL